MSNRDTSTDLAAEAFVCLRNAFFDQRGSPEAYRLRDKRNTQDDPLDEQIHKLVSGRLPAGTNCIKAPGRLSLPT